MKLDAAAFSIKRLAWAYGCARKGSDEESALLQALVEKVRSAPAPAGRMPRLRAVPTTSTSAGSAGG